MSKFKTKRQSENGSEPSPEGWLTDTIGETVRGLRDPTQVAADYAMRSALSQHPSLRAPPPTGIAVVIEVPGPAWVAPITAAWRETLLSSCGTIIDGDRHGMVTVPTSTAGWWLEYARDGDSKGHTPSACNDLVAHVLSLGGSVLGVSHAPERHLPRDLMRVADYRVAIAPLDRDTLTEIIIAVTGSAPSSEVSDDLARGCNLADIALARRLGESGEQFLQRLRGLAGERGTSGSISLADLAGMDDAVAWGLDLARDLADYAANAIQWSAVDRGALLSGPPGTGKTTFARALAQTCGVPLIAGSLGQWQAAGHLGDLLREMRAAFDSARSAAPAILFLDEIDSFGDRVSFDKRNRDYGTQVINGLLELLDGVAGREGIVVVGACNHPDRLDPALVRSGRLDRHLYIPLPDQTALARIIRHHLGADLPDVDLSSVAQSAVGSTGADIERYVRCARRRARHQRRPVLLDDLLLEIRGLHRQLQPETRRRVAIHEAGHAVAAALLMPEALLRATLRQTERTNGGVEVELSHDSLSTRPQFNALVIHLLAGRAAEDVMLGSVSTGAGGDEASDLARATVLVANTITALGFADEAPLVWLGHADPQATSMLLRMRPDLARQVHTRLDLLYGEAQALIRTHAECVIRIADVLEERETLHREEILALLTPSGAPTGNTPIETGLRSEMS